MGRTASIGSAALCGHCARRRREVQVKLCFCTFLCDPLRTSCEPKAQNTSKIAFPAVRRSRMSKARDAGKIVFSAVRAQPSAEIVRVEGAECR